MFAQIVSDQLGVAVKDVILVEGDTGTFEWGVATFASRAAVCSGNAIHKTAIKVRKKVIEAAANMMEADISQVDLEDGHAFVKGTNRKVALSTVATASNPLRYAFNEAAKAATQFAPASRHDGPALFEGQHPGLEDTDFFSPECATWAYGVHAAIVEIDPITCQVNFHKYVTIHDCGNMINPTIVEGQVLGGFAQGIAGALYEHIDFDEDGNPTNASFVDFLIPYATEIPSLEIHHLQTPAPGNPLGIKGVGEAGCIAVGTTVASGIEDALKHVTDRTFRHVPITPSMIQEAIVLGST